MRQPRLSQRGWLLTPQMRALFCRWRVRDKAAAPTSLLLPFFCRFCRFCFFFFKFLQEAILLQPAV